MHICVKVEYNIESGEQDCTELISDMAVNGCPKLSNIKEESIDIPKLKEKLKSISNPYFIAPYDSLQLYQYEVCFLFQICSIK